MIQFVPYFAVTPLSVAIHSLRSSVQGRLILPAEPGYEEAQLAWNQKVDQHPAMILLAKSAQDVMKAAPFTGHLTTFAAGLLPEGKSIIDKISPITRI